MKQKQISISGTSHAPAATQIHRYCLLGTQFKRPLAKPRLLLGLSPFLLEFASVLNSGEEKATLYVSSGQHLCGNHLCRWTDAQYTYLDRPGGYWIHLPLFCQLISLTTYLVWFVSSSRSAYRLGAYRRSTAGGPHLSGGSLPCASRPLSTSCCLFKCSPKTPNLSLVSTPVPTPWTAVKVVHNYGRALIQQP